MSSHKQRIDRLARHLSLGIEGYVLYITDEDGNYLDHSGQIAYTPEEWERWQATSLEAVIDLSQEH